MDCPTEVLTPLLNSVSHSQAVYLFLGIKIFILLAIPEIWQLFCVSSPKQDTENYLF